MKLIYYQSKQIAFLTKTNEKMFRYLLIKKTMTMFLYFWYGYGILKIVGSTGSSLFSDGKQIIKMSVIKLIAVFKIFLAA